MVSAPMSSSRRPLDVAVIGGSMGAVRALATILPTLPATLSFPVVIVVHIPPTSPSGLAALFGSRCSLRVREAEDKETLAPGCVYFAPSDYHLLVDSNRTLALSCEDPVHFSRPAIDVLFESAADAFGEGVLGVVLTGASADGAEGLRAIAEAGGITIVQDPSTAEVAVMPYAALKAARGSLPLPIAAIGPAIAAHSSAESPR